jgi:NH3-dependent NAD+ synthetase
MKTESAEVVEACEVRDVRMLTQSEISALRDDNIKAHLRMQELIAEAKKHGPLVIR